ncbi:mitochondrial gtpase 1 [Ophiostoma piceae UAMH 11346]|uniref:Mitochondrial gtpase 1 n=1 Tax=Ophiostoma piceae (strain UAMH 11346) TaxID=1262450 RepID=S3C399_OPHP1|nr:mitochondrial gtpase 1 [Ophiostoma piceae UAMH 11346]
MASIRSPAGLCPAVWQAYTRAGSTAARSRSAYTLTAFAPRSFSACITRCIKDTDPASSSPEELHAETREGLPTSSVPPKPESTQPGLASQERARGPFQDFPNFQPRTVYEPPKGTLKSYFIGHHRTALVNMRVKLASVGLVIECRDLRVPLSSSNPLLEATLMRTRTAKKHKRGGVKDASSSGSKDSPEDGNKEGVDQDDDDGTTLPGLSGHLPPAAERNPLLSVGDTDNRRMRVIVYTKRDLMQREASKFAPTAADFERLAAMDEDSADAVIFLGNHSAGTQHWKKRSGSELRTLMKALRQAARAHGERSLTPLYALVVGMPNSGKSTLLNRLRAEGMTDASRRSKASRTGSEAGVTRKLGTPVRILEDTSKVVGGPLRYDQDEPYVGSSGGENAGLLVSDTPGVFMPYVPDPETMIKLALVGTVREGIVLPTALADYLLFQLNKRDPRLYMKPFNMHEPTEDTNVLLDQVARRIGKLGKSGVPDHDAAAQHLISAFRHGKLGNFCLDDLSPEAVDEALTSLQKGPPLSLNQAKKREKELRRQMMAERRGKMASALTEF